MVVSRSEGRERAPCIQIFTSLEQSRVWLVEMNDVPSGCEQQVGHVAAMQTTNRDVDVSDTWKEEEFEKEIQLTICRRTMG